MAAATGMDRQVTADRLRPEARLLLACCGESQPDAHASSLLDANFDWEWLERCANANGVTPMVARRLPALHVADAMAGAAAAHLRRFKIALQANALRNEHMAAELARILGRFSAEGIDAIAFKGPVLAASAYGDLAIRSFADLDLLVHPGDVACAVRMLVEDGYGLSSGRQFDPAIFSAFEGGFEASRGDDHVDLHCRIRRRRFHFFPDDEGIWARSVWIDLNGERTRTFAPRDLALYLCAHASKHGWGSMQMVCDLAGVIRSAALDADSLLDDAARLGCCCMMLMGLLLASRLLGTQLSRSAMERLRDEPALSMLADSAVGRMFSGIEQEHQPAHQAENPSGIAVRLMDRQSDRLRYWFFRAVTPTMGDWEFLPLPSSLYPAYFLIRPVRLASQMFRRSSAEDN